MRNSSTKDILKLILSRTIRSCRATTHSDLATLVDPISKTYYCHKHGKICKPLFSILRWWETYSIDTVERLIEFNQLKTETKQICLTSDSKEIDLIEELRKMDKKFAAQVKKKKINGIFSSPPYVGLMIMNNTPMLITFLVLQRDLEIGAMFKEGLPKKSVVRIFGNLFLFPAAYIINPIISFFQKLLGIDKRFPIKFILRYKKLFREYYGMDPNAIAQENYWLAFFRVSSFSQPNASLIKTWLHLYGFSRNSSAAAYLILTVMVVCFYFYPSSYNTFARFEAGVLFIIAVILGIRYWLLYSSYYTKNIIRAFIEVSVPTKRIRILNHDTSFELSDYLPLDQSIINLIFYRQAPKV